MKMSRDVDVQSEHEQRCRCVKMKMSRDVDVRM